MRLSEFLYETDEGRYYKICSDGPFECGKYTEYIEFRPFKNSKAKKSKKIKFK